MRVAIDGPAGSGKSTVAKRVSLELRIPYLESGLAYRAFGLLVMRRGLEVSWRDLEPLFELVEISPEVGGTVVRVEGRCVNELLGGEEVGRVASLIGTLPEFRRRINEVFRRLIGSMQVVVEGRDAGTDIVPDADVKIFLTASPEERARRRVRQLLERGEKVDYGRVLRDILERDRRDSERKVGALRPAPDAVVIDTTGKPVEEVVGEVLRLLRKG